MNHRQERVNDSVARELGEIIRQVKDPRVSSAFVTVNAARVTPDLKFAKIYFGTILGDPAEVQEGLERASGFLRSSLAKRLESLTDKARIDVYEIKNRFFGESITVSGLLTGKDIYEQLSGKSLGDALLIPRNALRSGEDVFLCGMTLSELSQKLKTDIRVCENDGFDFIDAAFGR